MFESRSRGVMDRRFKGWFVHSLWAAALLVLSLAPSTSQAHIIISNNGFDVYLCNDGTTMSCFSPVGNFTFQVNCNNLFTSGSIACAYHGGFASMGHSSGREASNYLGEFDLASMGCTDCEGIKAPDSYAQWLGICSGKTNTSLTCSETDASCFSKQDAFQKSCSSSSSNTLTSFWYINFQLQRASP